MYHRIHNKLNGFFGERARIGRELRRIKKIPRFTEGKTGLFGKEIMFSDSASFLYMYDEIFSKEIYDFVYEQQSPFVLDAGSNIGLSIIYFKNKYPYSRIIGFEADPKIYNILKKNVEAMGFNSVELHNTALWDQAQEMEFVSQGADAGRMGEFVRNEGFGEVLKIESDILSRYIDQEVDLLKIDIEGAETRVLCECRHKLFQVKRLFVEYHSFTNRPQELATLLDILSAAGYRVHIKTVFVYNKPFYFRKDDGREMDMQLNIFAFRT
jgi:FkbM family methyltransferase